MESDPFTFTYMRLPDHHYRFQSTLLECTDQVLVLIHRLRPKSPVIVEGQTAIEVGDIAVWFLGKGKASDVAHVYSPKGELKGYYADALEPVHWESDRPDSLRPLVDLFLDIWMWLDGRAYVLDDDEFENAVEKGWLSDQQASLARNTIHELLRDAEGGFFPSTLIREYEVDRLELLRAPG